jgi:hypothetical protein
MNSDCRRTLVISFLVFLATWSGIQSTAVAKQSKNDGQTTENWISGQVERGEEANLNVRCGADIDIFQAEDENSSTNNCRRISGAFLAKLLTQAPSHDRMAAGIHITGARIRGDINLQDAEIKTALQIEQSRIENDINLGASRTEHHIGVVGSVVVDSFNAGQMHNSYSLILRGTEFKQLVDLNGATFGGDVLLDGATFGGSLDASYADIGGSLSAAANRTSFKHVSLRAAKISRVLMMDGAVFDGYFRRGAQCKWASTSVWTVPHSMAT